MVGGEPLLQGPLAVAGCQGPPTGLGRATLPTPAPHPRPQTGESGLPEQTPNSALAAAQPCTKSPPHSEFSPRRPPSPVAFGVRHEGKRGASVLGHPGPVAFEG